MPNLFQYVLIPAESTKDVETKQGDASGGLENDELIQSAKDYFYAQSDAAQHVTALQNAAEDERNQLAEKFRLQNANPNLDKLSNDQILRLLETQHSTSTHSCEIIALTVATRGNGFQAVSMYISQYSEGLQKNERATSLMAACGHALPAENSGQREHGIYGDAFVGRAYDNEDEEWRRLDFAPNEILPSSDWIQVARAVGGGGGQGNIGVAPSLSGSMKQIQLGNNPGTELQQQQENAGDLGYTWSQNDEEVELKFKCAANIKAKDVKIKFSRTSLDVSVGGKVLLAGPTGGLVVVDESTFTLQDEGSGRELCVILAKAETGRLWAKPVEADKSYSL